MSKSDPDVAMAACMTDKATLTEACKDIENVYIANENSASQTVASGSADGIAKLEEKLTSMGIKAVRLKVSGAFHSPYMKEASEAFRAHLDGVTFGESGRVYANATGEKYTEEIADLLEKQLLNPVLFRTSAEKAYEDGSRIFVEVGNGKVLTGLLRDCLAGKDYTAVALCPEKDKNSAEQLEFAMAQLAVLGVSVKDDPYRAPHNEDMIPKKSKTTYTVKMQSFLLPKHREAMEAALLPDQRIIDIMKKAQEPVIKEVEVVKEVIKEVEVVKEVVKPMETKTNAPAASAYSANAEVFSKFMDVQTQQMQAASDMFSKAGADSEKQNVLNCVTVFQNNSMRALEAYFGNSAPAVSAAPAAPIAPIAPVVPVAPVAPVVSVAPAAPVAPAVSAAPAVKADVDIYALLTEAIADKTGYPTDMIDEDMELEADLGIDSIKRVEIFADVLKKLNVTLTPDQTEELSAMATMEEIASYLSQIV